MPILWRYLLRNFLQVFVLSVAGFIAVLLVTRFQNIARFAASGAPLHYVVKFVALQIPFILPLAIPISCLISAFLLLQKMSRSHELTALRCAGLGMAPILFPLLSCCSLIALLNFTIVSEISPNCRGLSKSLAYQMTAINPLCLLKKGSLIKLKDLYLDMRVLKSGKFAEDVCFITKNTSSDRLAIMLAKKLSLEEDRLTGSDVTFISSINTKNGDCFDHLMIENQAEMQTEANQLSQYLRSSEWNLSYDYLSLRMLQAKNRIEAAEGEKWAPRAFEELSRRISLGMAAFTFTLIGIAYGLEISRQHKVGPLLWALCLATLYLTAFITAKSIKHFPFISSSCYLLPHLIIPLFCLFQFKQIAQGAE